MKSIQPSNPTRSAQISYRFLFIILFLFQVFWLVYAFLSLAGIFLVGGLTTTEETPGAGPTLAIFFTGILILNIKILSTMTKRKSPASTLIGMNAILYLLTQPFLAYCFPGQPVTPTFYQVMFFAIEVLAAFSYWSLLPRMNGSPGQPTESSG